MIRCDALVVGGGPAGSTCARALGRAGWNVVVADRARFPRDKVCAGWLTPEVFGLLEFDPAEYRATGATLQEISGFRTGVIGDALVETTYSRVVSYAIRRREFDAFLLRRAGAQRPRGDTRQDPPAERRQMGRQRHNRDSGRHRRRRPLLSRREAPPRGRGHLITRGGERNRVQARPRTRPQNPRNSRVVLLQRHGGLRVERTEGRLPQRRHRPKRQQGFRASHRGVCCVSRTSSDARARVAPPLARPCLHGVGRRRSSDPGRRDAGCRRCGWAGIPGEWRRNQTGDRVWTIGSGRADRLWWANRCQRLATICGRDPPPTSRHEAQPCPGPRRPGYAWAGPPAFANLHQTCGAGSLVPTDRVGIVNGTHGPRSTDQVSASSVRSYRARMAPTISTTVSTSRPAR